MMAPRVYVMRVGTHLLGTRSMIALQMGRGRGCESPLVFPSLFLDSFLIVPFDVAIRSCLLHSACLSLILSPALRNKRAGPRPVLHLVNIAQLEAH